MMKFYLLKASLKHFHPLQCLRLSKKVDYLLPVLLSFPPNQVFPSLSYIVIIKVLMDAFIDGPPT